MITPSQRAKLLDDMPYHQRSTIEILESMGWTFIDYKNGKATMASPSRSGVSHTRTIHLDGTG